jgi:hypothetical protein
MLPFLVVVHLQRSSVLLWRGDLDRKLGLESRGVHQRDKVAETCGSNSTSHFECANTATHIELRSKYILRGKQSNPSHTQCHQNPSQT